MRCRKNDDERGQQSEDQCPTGGCGAHFELMPSRREEQSTMVLQSKWLQDASKKGNGQRGMRMEKQNGSKRIGNRSYGAGR